MLQLLLICWPLIMFGLSSVLLLQTNSEPRPLQQSFNIASQMAGKTKQNYQSSFDRLPRLNGLVFTFLTQLHLFFLAAGVFAIVCLLPAMVYVLRLTYDFSANFYYYYYYESNGQFGSHCQEKSHFPPSRSTFNRIHTQIYVIKIKVECNRAKSQ